MIIKRIQLQLVFILLLLTSATSSIFAAQETPLDNIAAIVNNDVIMFSEIRKVAIQVHKKGSSTLTGSALVKEILDQLILEKIQTQRAKALGIKVSNEALNEAMEGIAGQNKLNLTQFRLALINEGINYKAFRESIREKLYINLLRKRQQGRNNRVSEEDIDDLIKAESPTLNKDVQYRLLDILIPSPNGISVSEFNKRRKAAQILRRKLLIHPSTIPAELITSMGATQQKLGWKSTTELSPAFVRTLSLMGIGELSNIVRDARGFHILKIEEQRGGKRQITQQTNIRHILIPSTVSNGKVKATQIRNKILAGEDFGTLARKHSADTGSATNGGELGLSDPAIFVPPFAAAARTLPLNTLSHPIKTRFGWHIMEVLERKSTDQTREALKKKAQSLITKQNKSDEYKSWLQGLRDQAFVEYRI